MRKMQFTNDWQRFEHTGRVEDYLNYLHSAQKDRESHTLLDVSFADCRVTGETDTVAGEDGSCRNPCM